MCDVRGPKLAHQSLLQAGSLLPYIALSPGEKALRRLNRLEGQRIAIYPYFSLCEVWACGEKLEEPKGCCGAGVSDRTSQAPADPTCQQGSSITFKGGVHTGAILYVTSTTSSWQAIVKDCVTQRFFLSYRSIKPLYRKKRDERSKRSIVRSCPRRTCKRSRIRRRGRRSRRERGWRKPVREDGRG